MRTSGLEGMPVEGEQFYAIMYNSDRNLVLSGFCYFL
jgi:hypothetical protein